MAFQSQALSKEVQLLHNLVIVLSSAILTWAIFVQIWRTLQFSFASLVVPGYLVTIGLVAGTLYSLMAFSLGAKRQQFYAGIVVILLASVFAYVRSNIFLYGSDVFDYLSMPAYLLVHPSTGMSFTDMPYYQFGEGKVGHYWISYTFEYYLAFLSRAFDLDFISLCFITIPSALTFLVFIYLYGLVRLLGVGWALSVVMAVVGLWLVGMDTGNGRTWGYIAVGRLYENKGFLFGPGFLFCYFLMFKGILFGFDWKLQLSIFLLTASMTQVTANAIYLLPIVFSIFLVPCFFLDSGNKITQKKVLKTYALALCPCVMMFLMLQLVANESVYDFVGLDSASAESDEWLFLSNHIKAVFGDYHWIAFPGFLLSAISMFIAKEKQAKLLLSALAFQLLLIFGIPLFELIKILDISEYRVYWRFMMCLPLYLFVILALACSISSGPRQTLLAALGLLLVYVGAPEDGRKVYSFQDVGMATQHKLKTRYENVIASINRDDKGVTLAPVVESKHLSVLHPDSKPLIGSPYFTIWKSEMYGQRPLAEIIVASQKCISARLLQDPNCVAALSALFSKVRVKALILKTKHAAAKSGRMLARHGYVEGTSDERYTVYVLE